MFHPLPIEEWGFLYVKKTEFLALGILLGGLKEAFDRMKFIIGRPIEQELKEENLKGQIEKFIDENSP